MPKEYKKYDGKNIQDTRYEKRAYAGRMFINPTAISRGKTSEEEDMETLEIRDYSFEATSFPDAMSQWTSVMIQQYVSNTVVRVVQEFTAFFESSLADNEELAKEWLEQAGDDLDYEDLNDFFGENWSKIPIPVSYAIDVLKNIMEGFTDLDNKVFWQEPELVVIGNPHILENMGMGVETLGDVADKGMKEVAEFLKDAVQKSKKEEE